MTSPSLHQAVRGLLLLLPVWLTLPMGSAAAPSVENNQQFNGLIREPVMLRVTLPDGKPALLDALVTRPSGPGRWPIALITNGTTGTAEFDRWEMNPNRMSGTALAFARHGYAAVVVLREGYGYSSGGAEYTGGTCAHPQHGLARKRDADDLLSALNAIRRQPWASGHNAILAGMSAGGFGALAAGAGQPSGVQAIINFDGGRGASSGSSVCDQAGLLRTFAEMGAASHTPSLWLYSQNDKFFPPLTALSFFNAYISAGGSGSFVVMPPYRANGHAFMDSAPEDFWWGPVGEFLHKEGMPYKEVVRINMKNIPLPLALNNAEGKSAFREYESAQLFEKAFATDASGDWGVSYWARTATEAAAAALRNCQKHQQSAQKECTVYAVNNTVMAN
ncbi:CocE/NonD family hydrolase [Enterobacter sp. BRE11]|nr:CocE/NonD family hydrolase [Enterobacter sp. BRE11]